MRVLIFILSFVLSNIVIADHSEHAHLVDHDHKITQPELKAGNFDPNGELITVGVNGLVCDFCAQAIEKVFMRRDEVSGINVNLNKGEIIISSKANKKLANDVLEKLILDAGYNLVEIKRQQSGS